MRLTMKNTPIGARIALALALPILGLLLFSSFTVIEKRQTVNEMQKLQGLADLGPVISAVVHELQKERGTSAVYIGSKGKKFAEQLPVQRKDTDGKHAILQEAWKRFEPTDFSEALVQKVTAAKNALGQLENRRAKVSKFELSVPQMAGYYTPTIAKLLSIIEEMAVLSSDARVANAITAYTSFLQGKERAGIERAMGGAGFGAGKFAPVIYKKLIELIAQQNTFFGTFRIYGTEEQKTYFKTTAVGPDVEEVDHMRKIAIESIETKDVKGIEGPYWFRTITKKVDLLKKVEDKIAGDLRDLTVSIQSDAQGTFLFASIATALLLIVTAAIVYLIVRGITGPIGEMTRAMTDLAEGNKSTEIAGTDRGDEIGSMANAVRVFKDSMIRADGLAEEQKLEQRSKEERQARVDQYISEFELTIMTAMEGLKNADSVMRVTGEEMTDGANANNAQATTVAAAAEQASINVQTVASATEELSSSLQEVARQVTESAVISADAVSETEKTMENVKQLEASVSKIGEVVSLITDIAEQTNLLALNATIEAARAGDAGKGFAVVASEVKNLANQTAKATDEISSQIHEVQQSTSRSVNAIRGITEVINRVSEVSSSISAAIEEQTAATQEIASNVEQAASGTGEVSSAIDKVRDAAAKSLELAENIQESSDGLSEQTESLNENVTRFLSKVRSADQSQTENLIVWDESLSVGNGMIDGEHQKLIGIVNELYTAVLTGGGGNKIAASYQEMLQYTDYHFSHEEELMAEIAYRDAEAHTRQHRKFTERLDELYQSYRSGEDPEGKALLNLLGSWWSTHITTSDIKLAAELQLAA